MIGTYCVDEIKLDSDRITEGKDDEWGDVTIFNDVVIASEIVQTYADGKAFKSRDELKAYAPTVKGRWVMTGNHPEDGIISDRSQIHGRTMNPRYVIDLVDPKTERPNRAGVRADVEIFNDNVPATLLDEMKKGEKNDVSIGFFFTKDDTAGVVADGAFKGAEYDYIQTNMFHDHLAAGIDQGRCTAPYCGIGADALKQRLTGNQIAGFANLAEGEKKIREENPKLSDEAVASICGKLKSEHEGDIVEETSLSDAKNKIETLLRDEYETIKGEILSQKEQTTGDWWRRLDWTSDEYRAMYDTLGDETRVLIMEAGLCPDCQTDEKKIGADLSLEQINKKLTELKDSRDVIREKIRPLETELYSETPEEKKRDAKIRDQINQLWDEMQDISDEIYAYGQAKTIKITESALNDSSEDGECEEGFEKNEDGECVKIKAEPKKDKLDPREVLDRFDALGLTE